MWRAKLVRMLAYMMTALEPRKKGADQIDASPENVAVATLLPSLDIPRQFDTIDSQRVVFSTDPKPLQLKLGERATAIFSEMAQAVRSEPPKEEDADEKFGDGVPFRTNLAVEHTWSSAGEYMNFTITVFDQAGALIGQREAATWDPTEKHRSYSLELGAFSLRILYAVNRLKLSETDLAYFHEKPLTSALRDILLQPLTQDPTQFMGDLVIAYAERKHLPGCRGLGDNSAYLLSFRDCTNEDDVWAALSDEGAAVSNDWITLSRTEADTETSQVVMNRHKLQKFVDSVTDESPNLETLVKADRLGLEQVGRTSQRRLYTKLLRNNSDLPQLLALLSDGQIKSLLAGDESPFSIPRRASKMSLNSTALSSAA